MDLSPATADPSKSRERELRETIAAMRRRIVAGEPASAEAALEAHPEIAGDDDSAVELIYAEFSIRGDLRQAPATADWLARFPRHADRLRRLLDLHGLFEEHDPDEDAPTALGSRSPLIGDGPRAFGEFDLLELIGRGGEGVVYRARRREDGRVVAVKLLLEGAYARPDERQRLREKAESCRVLDHPNIVRVDGTGEVEGLPYLVLELVEGGTLADRIAAGVSPRGDSVGLMIEIADAVAEFHRFGIIHRDLHPRNVLLDLQGRPKVADLGLAEFLGQTRVSSRLAALAGTAGYIAREVARGRVEEIGFPSDVFSLGAIAYELLTGAVAFPGETPLERLRKTLEADVEPPSRLCRGLSPRLSTIVMNCLDREPSRRYATAAELADDLRRHRDGRPTRGRIVPPWERARRRLGLVSRSAIVAASATLLGSAVYLLIRLDDQLGRDRKVTAEVQARARRLAHEAEAGRALADRRLYASGIKAAQDHWNVGHYDLAIETLDDLPPGPRGFEAGHIDRIFRREYDLLRGHSRTVRRLALAPGGAILATGAEDGEVILWDLARRKPIRRLREAEGLMSHLTFSSDGARLAAATFLGDRLGSRLVAWDVDSGRLTVGPFSADSRITQLAFAPGGGALWALEAKPGTFGLGHFFESRGTTASPPECLPISTNGPVAFSADGRWIAWASEAGEATLVDRQTGRVRWKAPEREAARLELTFSPDGEYLAASGSRVVRSWETTTGRLIGSHPTARESVSLEFTPDGRVLTSQVYFGPFSCWDAATGRPIEIQASTDDTQGGRALLDGRSIALGRARAPAIWDLGTGLRGPVFPFRVREGPVSDLKFTRDGRTLIIASHDERVRLWDLAPSAPPGTTALDGHPKEVWSLAFSPDGATLASGSDDETIKLWDRQTGRESACLVGHAGTVSSLAYSPDGSKLAAADLGEGGSITLWDLATGRPAWSHGADPLGSRSIAYSPDGRLVASGGTDGRIRIWEATTGRCLLDLPGHDNKVKGLAFSPDGSTLASACQDATIALWDPKTGRKLAEVRGPSEYTSICFSPDGSKLVAGCHSGNLEIREVGRDAPPLVLRGHLQGVRSVAFSPDGRTIASGSLDRSVRLWDPITGLEFLTLGPLKNPVYAVAFSPDGTDLAGASHDGEVRVWHGRAEGNLGPRTTGVRP